jgi:aryl-alcohol dehydrogenase-like predicted oxidoreductase
LGGTSLDMGKLGFGIAGPLASPVISSVQTESLIEQALIGGIRFFDTGPSYGGGRGEQRLGRVIARNERNNIFVSTKAGLTEQGKRDFSPANIANSLHRSLERLQTNHVDCLFLHGIASNELNQELMTTLADLRSQGLFLKLGIAGRGEILDIVIADRSSFDLVMLAMGPNQLVNNLNRALAARKAGLQVIGIEMLAHTRSTWKLSVRPADLWHMARYLRRGGQLQKAQSTMTVLKQALEFAKVDMVLSSTTKKEHLQEWLDCLDEHKDSS